MNSFKKRLFSLSLVSLMALAIVGLSSWKAPQTKKKGDADTTKKSKKQEAHYSKKTIITFDKNGNPHEEVIESFEGDDNLREPMGEGLPFNFDFPPIPDFDISIPDFPGVYMPPMNELFFDMDSIDFDQLHFDEGNLEMFNEDLEHRLREQFEVMEPEMQARMEDLGRKLQEMDFSLNQTLGQNLDEQMLQLDERLKDIDLNLNDQLKTMDFNLDKLNAELERINEYAIFDAERLKEFEQAARNELVKDGYLKESEKIESMSWSDDAIEFNGIAIKEKDAAKYRELKEKFLNRKSFRGRTE